MKNYFDKIFVKITSKWNWKSSGGKPKNRKRQEQIWRRAREIIGKFLFWHFEVEKKKMPINETQCKTIFFCILAAIQLYLDITLILIIIDNSTRIYRLSRYNCKKMISFNLTEEKWTNNYIWALLVSCNSSCNNKRNKRNFMHGE